MKDRGGSDLESVNRVAHTQAMGSNDPGLFYEANSAEITQDCVYLIFNTDEVGGNESVY